MQKEQQNKRAQTEQIKNRYIATMVLAAVGDAMGYRRGSWEFNRSGTKIHKQMMKITNQSGIRGLKINIVQFPYSDDTVMHIATAKGLLQSTPDQSLDQICVNVAKHYKQCMRQMQGRAPGMTCIRSTNALKLDGSNWKDINFQKNGGGCGASMRAACIGLYFHNDINKLIQVSIETGRTTHHNPLGYLGSLVAALFTSFSIHNKDPKQWLALLLSEYLPRAKQYVRNNREAQLNIKGGDWGKFQQCWIKYAQKRKMLIDSPSEPVFPENYGVEEREADYHQLAINGWPGALGVDSVIIAYDALLSTLDWCRKRQKQGISTNKWDEVCLRGMLHGGDSDSTGTIVGAWYGALYGFQEVYEQNFILSENRKLLEQLGRGIYQKALYPNKEQNRNQN